METLTDESPMPFGIHKGKKMKNVPASYLHFVWCKCRDQRAVTEYIRTNLASLKLDHPDGIW